MDPCNCTVTYALVLPSELGAGLMLFLCLAGASLLVWALASPMRAVVERVK